VKKFLILFLFFYFSLSISAKEVPLKIHFLDVGEGDSILVEAPTGETLLIDTGNFISGFKVSQYLKEKNIQRLEHLIFTHPHLDHIGGAFLMVQEFSVKDIYDNGENLPKQDIYRWYEQLVRQRAGYRVLSGGDELSVGEFELEILWPARPFVFSDFNVNSLVIMIKYNDFRCLLMADATDQIEKTLLKTGRDFKAEVLKVGHHGAGDASGIEFLQAVSPKIAVISVDRDNIRGYPSAETLERLKKSGSKILRTDQSGTILLTVDRKGKLTLKEER